ncbi:fatty acid desaturase [Bacillus salacetis]|uniref:Fatty acid desaturase n=1 Tax=Bacillus salacetis TaxID=2315464 RepID=A0A3A1QQS7_9BACI|nr:fatty acid desaturase [Bacillus salacetis]RIW27426.1 fatty acid desaturase [Bacillus salacetis]
MTKHKMNLLRKQVSPFEGSETARSIFQLVTTLTLFIAVWAAAFWCISVSYLLTLALGIVGAGLLTRIFIIFHDCCHNSFFKKRKANEVIGTITGIITLFPFRQWQHDHSVHHATSSNLDKRGTGDIWMMTVEEYKDASFWKKVSYRLYRNPFVMFGLGPVYVFLITNRFNRKGARKKERINTYVTNIAIAAIVSVLCYTAGWQAFLLVHGTIFYIAGIMGIWLFYVQHTFEDSYFEENKEWDFVLAAVEGSSFYKLPRILQWFTGNIGFHHVHHLAPRVPNYKLEAAHKSSDSLQHVPTITLATSLSSLKFKLWDETNKKFVRFKDIRSLESSENIPMTD